MIVLVAKYRKLQTLSFLVSLQVMVTDLLTSLALLTGFISSVANKWVLGEYVCSISGFFLTFSTQTRLLLMCTFVIDRYLAVNCPYFYPKHNLKITITFSVCSWVFCLLMTGAMLPWLLDCYAFSFGGKMCLPSPRCSYPCSLFTPLYFAVVIIPATVLPVTLYIQLYCKARKIRQSLRQEAASVDVNLVTNEWKPIFTFFLLFLAIFVLIVPTTVISVILSFVAGGVDSPASYVVITANTCITFLLVVADPIVMMRDKDIKEVLSGIMNNISTCICQWRGRSPTERSPTVELRPLGRSLPEHPPLPGVTL